MPARSLAYVTLQKERAHRRTSHINFPDYKRGVEWLSRDSAVGAQQSAFRATCMVDHAIACSPGQRMERLVTTLMRVDVI